MSGKTSESKKDYVDIANEYIDGVLSGKIVACKWVRLACERQRRDLAREGWEYHFDRDKANRVCKFTENLHHIKGKWARERKRIKLEPWQIFILTTIFGWVDDDGLRRFTSAYIEIARKNAKTTLASAIALYGLLADGEAGSEVYSAATTREQARISFDTAKLMIEKDPMLRKHFGVQTGAHAITVPSTGSVFKALSRDRQGNLDGHSPHFAVVDELHAHKSPDTLNAIESGVGAREQPLILAITTAGFDLSGICYERRSFILKILEKTVDDQKSFGIVYTLDEDDSYTDSSVWIKSNPNLGVSVYPSVLLKECINAQETASARNNFLTKFMNVWVSASSTFFNMEAWNRNADPSLSLDDFQGEVAYMGLDLSIKNDFTAKLLIFQKDIDGETHYYVFSRCFLPEAVVKKNPTSPYATWALEGNLISTPGNIVDYDVLEAHIQNDAQRFNILEVATDAWNATQLSTRMLNIGIPIVQVPQNVKHLSEPTKMIEALIEAGRIHHDGDPCLAWQMSNVVVKPDTNDNIKPNKEFNDRKIDAPVAMVTAFSRILVHGGSQTVTSPWEDPTFSIFTM